MQWAYVSFIDGLFEVNVCDSKDRAVGLGVSDARYGGSDEAAANEAYQNGRTFRDKKGYSAVVKVHKY